MKPTSPNRLGSRLVVGVLVPNFNSVVEPELSELRVAGVTNQTSRFALDADVIENIATAAEGLIACGVGAFVVGLSTESFPGGLALLDRGMALLRERTGLAVHSPTYAVFQSLELMKTRKVGIVTPFDDDANANVRALYEERGFEVSAIVGLNRPGFDEIANTTDADTEAAFRTAAADPVEALVQIGTGLPTLHLVESLEREHGVPVVTSNSAAYWQALRAADITDSIPGKGVLFAKHRGHTESLERTMLALRLTTPRSPP